jgi:hypothetical protein
MSTNPTAQLQKTDLVNADPFTNSKIDSTSHLHMSDVECRGETIYFAVVDRFNIGKEDRLGKETSLMIIPTPTGSSIGAAISRASSIKSIICTISAPPHYG